MEIILKIVEIGKYMRGVFFLLVGLYFVDECVMEEEFWCVCGVVGIYCVFYMIVYGVVKICVDIKFKFGEFVRRMCFC